MDPAPTFSGMYTRHRDDFAGVLEHHSCADRFYTKNKPFLSTTKLIEYGNSVITKTHLAEPGTELAVFHHVFFNYLVAF
jgi:hypothetical protein